MSTIKSAILQATLELISLRGLQDTPMSKIATHADVSVGSIYRYFDNKEDLIQRLYYEIRKEFLDASLRGIDTHSDYRDIFWQIWKNMAEFYTKDQKKTSFMEHYENTPIIRDETMENEMHLRMVPLVEIIESAKEGKVLRNLPNMVIVSLLLEVVISLCKKHNEGKIVLDENLLEESFEASWTGISINGQ